MGLVNKNLNKLRLLLGKKQREMADLVGITASGWSNYEKGLSAPKLDHLITLSAFFKVSIDDLLTKDLSNVKLHVPDEEFLHQDTNILNEPVSSYGSNKPCDLCNEKDHVIATLKQLVETQQAHIKLLETKK